MARRGRKRNPKAKRNQTTRAGQGRNYVDTGPEERQARRAELGIAHVHTATDFPLAVLHARELITAAQRDVGLHFAAAHWSFVGHPFQSGTALASWIANDYGRLVRDEFDVHLHGLRVERRWRAYHAELRRAGPLPLAWTKLVAVDLELPPYLLKDLRLRCGPWRRASYDFLRVLRMGLEALRRATLPEVGPFEEDEILDGLARMAG